MMTKKKIKVVLTLAVMIATLVLAVATANAGVIYSETFDGDGTTGLDGVAATSGGTWDAKGNDWLMSDGSIIGGTVNNTYAGANLLPFEPELNKVYTLSMNLTHVGTKYIALGFTKNGIDYNQVDTSNRFPNIGGLSWFMYGHGGLVQIFEGLNETNEITNTGVYTAAKVVLSIVVDTTGDGSSFTADFLMDGVSITNGPQTISQSVDNINYAGIGAYGTRSGSANGSLIDNFQLSEGTVDETLPEVNAGVDMISWSGEPVSMVATIIDHSDPVTALTYAWAADVASLADANLTIAITDADQEDSTVEITKTADTDDATVVTLTLAANNVGSGKDDVIDTMTIDVYDNSCEAKIGAGQVVTFDPTDVTLDCITDIEDLARLVAAWLVDYTLEEPVVR